jgi:hypothetical protein
MNMGTNTGIPPAQAASDDRGQRRVLIKRPTHRSPRDGSHLAQRESSNSKTSGWQTMEEKEKMYAEVKARIFNAESGTNSPSAGGDSNYDTPSDPLSSKSPNAPSATTPSQTSTPISGTPPPRDSSSTATPNSQTADYDGSTNLTMEQALHALQAGPLSPVALVAAQQQMRAAGGASQFVEGSNFVSYGRTNKKPANWKPSNKFTPKDAENEKSDPDFARRPSSNHNFRQNNPNFHQQQQQTQNYPRNQPVSGALPSKPAGGVTQQLGGNAVMYATNSGKSPVFEATQQQQAPAQAYQYQAVSSMPTGNIYYQSAPGMPQMYPVQMVAAPMTMTQQIQSDGRYSAPIPTMMYAPASSAGGGFWSTGSMPVASHSGVSGGNIMGISSVGVGGMTMPVQGMQSIQGLQGMNLGVPFQQQYFQQMPQVSAPQYTAQYTFQHVPSGTLAQQQSQSQQHMHQVPQQPLSGRPSGGQQYYQQQQQPQPQQQHQPQQQQFHQQHQLHQQPQQHHMLQQAHQPSTQQPQQQYQYHQHVRSQQPQQSVGQPLQNSVDGDSGR